jgi:hypothetical protein
LSEAGQQHHHGGHGGHSLHSPGGGDGQSFSQFFDFGGGDSPQHNFLTHLLGLDHDAHGHGGGDGLHGDMAQHMPSHSAGWNSALQSIKLSDVLQGINVTPNFLFIVMFFGFIAWLFVIYWVRHHEPLANSVLGISAAHAPTANADRQLLAKTKFAFPNGTCESMGDIYVPGVPDVAVRPHGLGVASAAASSMPMPAPPVPPVPPPTPQPMPLSMAPTAYSVLPSEGAYMPAFGQPAPVARLKMIVNR